MSAAVTEAVSCCTEAARPSPPGLLHTAVAVAIAFHPPPTLSFIAPWYVCLSPFGFYSPFAVRSLAPGANTLSSQSGDNDCHLALSLIKSFPVQHTSFSSLLSLPTAKTAAPWPHLKRCFPLFGSKDLREFVSQQPGPPRISRHTQNFNYICGSKQLMNERFTCPDNKGGGWIQSPSPVIKTGKYQSV